MVADMSYDEVRKAILDAVAAGLPYTLGKTSRSLHNPERWRGFYNTTYIRCNGLSQFIPTGMLNAAIQKGKHAR